jgi:hypothetical protein
MRAEFPLRRGKAISILSAPLLSVADTFRCATSCSSLRGANATKQSRAAAELGCFAFARNDEMKNVLAMLCAPELCQPPRSSKSRPPQGGRRSADRRIPSIPRHAGECCHSLALRARQRLISRAARLSALRRGSRQDFDIPAQLQAMLPGTWFRRALPALACPSAVEAPHASAVVPKGMMPKAAPAQVASLRGSTALAPHFRSHPECVPR